MLKLLQYLAVPCLAMVSVSLYAAPAANFVCPEKIMCVFNGSRGTCTIPAGLDTTWSVGTVWNLVPPTKEGPQPITLPFNAAGYSSSGVRCIYYDGNQGNIGASLGTTNAGNYTPVGDAWHKQSDGSLDCDQPTTHNNLACPFHKK